MRPGGIAIHGAVWDFTPLDDSDGSDGAGCLRFDLEKAAKLRDVLSDFLRYVEAREGDAEDSLFLRVL